MKTLHIINHDEFLSLNGKNQLGTSHGRLLGDGRLLVMIGFHSEAKADQFKETAKTALHLPHPLYDAATPIAEEHAQAVVLDTALFPEASTPEERLAIARKCTSRDIAARCQKQHPLMKLSTF